jgi:DNA-binding winged helix-turn-helix (wHTH) protein
MKIPTEIAGFIFNDFEVDLKNRQLKKSGKPLPINTKYFDVLVLLIINRGKLVTKQYIFDEIWSDVIVTDSALSQCIKDIRKQLEDVASEPTYIKTVPKHGFVFLPEVTEAQPEQKFEVARAIKEIPTRPYKFLDYYHEDDTQIYFGREIEINNICSKILTHRSFIIYGRSGVGKSSIVHAGLIPALKAEGHIVSVIRSFTDPVQEMINSLCKLNNIQGKNLQKLTLAELLLEIEKSKSEKSIIFFLDQFEEFFTLLSPEKQIKFLQTIHTLFPGESSTRKLVFVMREDLFAELNRLKEVIPEIYHHEYRLGRLNREQAIRVIIEPARVVGVPFDKKLANRILDDLSVTNYIDPPQLQIVCDALFDERDEDQGITLTDYHKLGGASKIIAGYLARVLNRFNVNELFIAKEILKNLISMDDQPLIMRTTDVKNQIFQQKKTGENLVEVLIEELARTRIIRYRRQGGEAWIELSHDFLIQEISHWLTEKDSALKKARSLIDRALENYRVHRLLIDRESIELIVPLGEQLLLTASELEVLARSMLQNQQQLPGWLVDNVPTMVNLFEEMANHNDPGVRLCTVEAIAKIPTENFRSILKNLALWDPDFQVRKAASIALVELYGTEGEKVLLAHESSGQDAGLKRRAISLAFVRDHSKNLVHLRKLPFFIATLVTLGLLWVRIIRKKRKILQESLGGTIGAAISGLMVGLTLGLVLVFAGDKQPVDAIPTILVLLSLGTFAGIAGGLGVSLGIVTMDHISFRHSPWWKVAGGAAGGAIIGGFVNVLGADTLWALFGQDLGEITGAFEGLVIGGGTGLGMTLIQQWKKTNRWWQQSLGAAFGAMCSAIFLTIVKGNLFSGSLDIIAHRFVDSQVKLEPLASFFGEVYFGLISRIVLGAMEGFLFGGLLIAGMELSKRKKT